MTEIGLFGGGTFCLSLSAQGDAGSDYTSSCVSLPAHGGLDACQEVQLPVRVA
jgi:hypothetical protein